MVFSKEVSVGPISLIQQENNLEEEVKTYIESQRELINERTVGLFFFFFNLFIYLFFLLMG